MIDRNKLKREQEARRRETELREAIALKEAKVVQTPNYTIEVEKDINIVQIETPAGPEAVAETSARRIVLRVELPDLSPGGVGGIDMEVIDYTRVELEVAGLYWLEVPLPLPVLDDDMECSYDTESKTLTVTLDAMAGYVPAPAVSLDLRRDGSIDCQIAI